MLRQHNLEQKVQAPQKQTKMKWQICIQIQPIIHRVFPFYIYNSRQISVTSQCQTMISDCQHIGQPLILLIDRLLIPTEPHQYADDTVLSPIYESEYMEQYVLDRQVYKCLMLHFIYILFGSYFC